MSQTKKRKTKGGPPKPRATSAVIEQRIRELEKLMLDRRSKDIFEYVAEQERQGKAPWSMDADNKPLCKRTIQIYKKEAWRRAKKIIQRRSTRKIKSYLDRRDRQQAKIAPF